MKQTFKRNVQKGFTLVELLIVVIILAILAAIVVPQFSSSTDDANKAALQANLATMRAGIELYKAQHNNTYPTAALITAQMTQYTLASGTTTYATQALATSAAGGASVYGPYIRGATLPLDPTSSATNIIGVPTTTGSPLASLAGTPPVLTLASGLAVGNSHYGYDEKTGQIISTKNPQF
jgi:prepilin-type N-terminal cleavage/methylation domain-containing protein